MTTYFCAQCATTHSEDRVVRSVAGKAAGCAVGIALGASTKDPWATLASALVGAAVGHWIDTEVAPTCPLCGEILHAVVPYLLT